MTVVFSAVRERCSNAELATARVHICSKNNFPTAAGLASSAAGYACLGKDWSIYNVNSKFIVVSHSVLFGSSVWCEMWIITDSKVQYRKKESYSKLCAARQGSGSACRSIYGGFVRWDAGVHDDGSDSIAVQVAPASHWPDLEMLILVVNVLPVVCK